MVNVEIKNILEDFKKEYSIDIIYCTISGSYLHGTNLPEIDGKKSDIDIRGIFLPTMNNLILKNYKDHYEKTYNEGYSCEYDVVFQSAYVFLHKLLNMECNATEMLFSMASNKVLLETEQSKYIYSNRMSLIRRDISSFMGMANAHRKGRGKKAGRYDRKSFKEVAHGFRSLAEAREIIDDLHITFPLKNADYYKKIKREEFDFNEIAAAVEVEYDKLVPFRDNKEPKIDAHYTTAHNLLLYLYNR